MMDAIGAKPWRGRTLRADDVHGAVISYEFAHGDASWLGRDIWLSYSRYRVVGIMQPGFRLLAQDASVWALPGQWFARSACRRKTKTWR